MTRPPRILFLADHGPQIGGGHVMRCLTLAGALIARGAACAFVAPPGVKALLAAFGPPRVEALDGEAAEVLAAYAPDWLVIDHYGLDARQEAALRAPGRQLMVLDDLGRPHDCDLLLDPGYGRAPDDYLGRMPSGARLLTGPRFALLRPDFARARPAALARRGAAPVGRVLASLGLTDVGAITGRAVRAVLPVLGEAGLDVAAGSSAPSLEALRALADPRVALHVDTTDMARLTAEADLALGAGGSSVWERACLGLPGVTLILADNQRELALRMQAQGLTLAVDADAPDFEARLREAFASLAADATVREAMSHRLAELCDGLGAQRVAEAMLPSPVEA